MAAENNLTTKFAKAQSIDFAEQFGKSIKNLLAMLKIQRKLTLSVGSTIKTYTSKVTLDGTTVAAGDIIPLSKVETEEGPSIELKWDKKRKAVTAEDIQKYGFEQAVSDTDDKLIKELQKELKKKFFAQLETGTTEIQGVGLQGAMAKGWGAVAEKFEDDDVETIAFINPNDIADYMATTNITVQTAFGLKYIENFMGVSVAVISASVPAKKVYLTASDNLVLAQANMSSGTLSNAFDFTTDETGIIGVTHDINKQRLTAETVTASALVLFAERLDGIVKATITESPAAAAMLKTTARKTTKKVETEDAEKVEE